jgi:hypothetical protein
MITGFVGDDFVGDDFVRHQNSGFLQRKGAEKDGKSNKFGKIVTGFDCLLSIIRPGMGR